MKTNNLLYSNEEEFAALAAEMGYVKESLRDEVEEFEALAELLGYVKIEDVERLAMLERANALGKRIV